MLEGKVAADHEASGAHNNIGGNENRNRFFIVEP
jgi:hypothetical protein